MFQLIGRILLAVAAGLLLYSGISGLITSLQTIQNLGGWKAVFDAALWTNVFDVFFSGLSIVLALPALFGFIRGKCGFWMFIFAALLGACVGVALYGRIQNGGFADALAVWNFVVAVLCPLSYALGTIFILLRRRGE